MCHIVLLLSASTKANLHSANAPCCSPIADLINAREREGMSPIEPGCSSRGAIGRHPSRHSLPAAQSSGRCRWLWNGISLQVSQMMVMIPQ
ncbi:hypothetical protein BAUCODRAFT_537758 [Baudoinia panamericana UAMH 10762]|uniref:Uncharacterized protein n=1 Tax=Baudoinia panamericana (strain UAMH 10762) TaxID=717646 RepID=M2N8B6_BAUPA|nr:uncharacterized protein BAUCODRAFT_537758 [Baudoinia panamericana UAMH 10762]EMC95339.1 hypothetical protein BAUCODRAFT_537758 [Baudoinia panamericana UAMH 10762]